MALTPKQQRFVEEYLVDLNGTQAAIRAGYSPRTAASQGERLLRNVEIQAAVTAGRTSQQERTQIDADRVLLEYARLGLSDVGQILDFSGIEPRLRPVNEISETARRAIASVKVKRYWEGIGEEAREVEITEFKLWDKPAALAKLAAHVGICSDTIKHRHGGDDTAPPIQHEHATIDATVRRFAGAIDALQSRVNAGLPPHDGNSERLDTPNGSTKSH